MSIYEARKGGDFLTLQITMQNLNNVCKSIKNWNADDIEKRFYGSRKELIEALNNCAELEIELFFSGFLCENPLIDFFADGQIDIRNLSANEKISVFIQRGLVLCQLTNHEPGFVVKPYWHEKRKQTRNKETTDVQ